MIAANLDDLETAYGDTVTQLIRRRIEMAFLLSIEDDIGTHDLSFTRESLAATHRGGFISYCHQPVKGDFLGLVFLDK